MLPADRACLSLMMGQLFGWLTDSAHGIFTSLVCDSGECPGMDARNVFIHSWWHHLGPQAIPAAEDFATDSESHALILCP